MFGFLPAEACSKIEIETSGSVNEEKKIMHESLG